MPLIFDYLSTDGIINSIGHSIDMYKEVAELKHYQTILLIVVAIMALSVIVIRLQAAKKPASIMKIIMPPIGMSTGFFMFLFPVMRVSWFWALGAFLFGVIFLAYPLIATSKFHVMDGKIYLRRSKAFIWILLILLAVRLILHSYIEDYITVPQTGAVFFVLAFGMLLPWRIAMYRGYRKVEKEDCMANKDESAEEDSIIT